MSLHNQLPNTFALAVQKEIDYNANVLNNFIDVDTLAKTLDCLENAAHELHRQLIDKVIDDFEVFLNSRERNYKNRQKTTELLQKIVMMDSVEHMQAKVAAKIGENVALFEDERLNREKVKALEALEMVLTKLDNISSYIDESLLLRATDSLLDLAKCVERDANLEDFDVKKFLQQKLHHLKEDLIQEIQKNFDEALSYHIEETNVTLRVRHNFCSKSYSTNVLSLQEIFSCLSRLQIWPKQMAYMKRSLFDKVLNPFFQQRCSQLSMHKETDTVQLSLILGNISRGEPTPADALNDLKKIDNILHFITESIFYSSEENGQLKRDFGKHIMPDLTKALIQGTIGTAIPTKKEDLEGYEQVAQSAIEWEKRWSTAFGLERFYEDGNVSLSTFVRDVDKQFSIKHRERVLSEGRRALALRDKSNNETEIVLNLLQNRTTNNPTYKITKMPKIINQLLDDTLSDACSLITSRPTLAMNLLETTYDLLDLYLALVPVFHRPQRTWDPYQTETLGDDSFWLADQIMSYHHTKSECFRIEGVKDKLQSYEKKLRMLGNNWHKAHGDRSNNDPGDLDSLTDLNGTDSSQAPPDLGDTLNAGQSLDSDQQGSVEDEWAWNEDDEDDI